MDQSSYPVGRGWAELTTKGGGVRDKREWSNRE